MPELPRNAAQGEPFYGIDELRAMLQPRREVLK
jgi:hypothetical protein